MQAQCHILIVDDIEMNRTVLANLLGPEYAYSFAENGDEALRYLRRDPLLADEFAQQSVDLVILDLNMPVLDGMECLTRLKADPLLEATPVLVCTVHDSSNAELQALSAGADDYVTKPFKPAVVRQRVLHILQRTHSAREANERLHGLIANLPGAVASFGVEDGQLRLTYISEGCKEITGFTPEELLARNAHGVMVDVHPDDWPYVGGLVKESLATGKPVDCTYRVRTKSGGWHAVHLATAAMPDDGGSRRFSGVYTDITEERENEAKIARLVDALPGGVAIYKIGPAVGGIKTVYSSEGVPKLSGRTMDEYLDWLEQVGVERTVFADDRNAVLEAIADAVVEGEPLNVTYRLNHKEGGFVWVQLSASKIGEEDGCAVYYAVFTVPTDEAMLYRGIVEESSTGVLVAELSSRKILYANETWRTFEHVDAKEDIIGRNLVEVVEPYAPVLTQGDVNALVPERYTAFHKIMGDGTQLQVSGRLIMWNGIRAYVLYMTDQTAENRYREQIQNMLDRIPTGVSIFEIDHGRLYQTYVNDGFYRMIGSTRSRRTQYTGFGTLEAAHPDDLPIIQATMNRVAQGDSMAECDYRIIGDDGRWIWIHLTGTVVERVENHLTCYVTFIDVTELMEARMAMQVNQTLVDAAMKSVSMYPCKLDLRTRRMSIEPDLSQLLHLPGVIENVPESLIEAGAIHPDDVEALRAMYDRVYAGEAGELEFRQRYQGMVDYQWHRLIYTPVPDETGRVVMAVGASLDIDAQKEREQSYEQQLRLKSALGGDVVSMALMNLTRNVVAEAESEDPLLLADLQAGSVDDVLATMVAAAPYEDERANLAAVASRQALVEANRRGQSHFAVRQHITGSEGWRECSIDLMQNPFTGDLEALFALHDIDAAVRTEQVVSTLVDTDYDAIFTINVADGRLRTFGAPKANDGLPYSMSLDSDEEGVAAYLRRFCIDEDVEGIIRDMSLAGMQARLEADDVHAIVYTMDVQGCVSHKRMSCRYLDARRATILCAVQDTTREWQIEQRRQQELSEALAAAQQASVAKTNFLSNMSHEMRTPMNAITGMTKLAQGVSGNPDETARYLKDIDNSSQYLLGVINDVLDMSRIESGRLVLHPQWANAAEILWTCVNMLIPAMKEKGIRFTYPDIEKAGNMKMLVDPLRVKQVIMNLLNNAMKFTPRGGEVALTIRNVGKEGSMTRDVVEVRDTGCGMSEDFLTRIFQPFEQERNEYSGSVQGTGLGLALVKRIVEAMGGQVSVKSELTKGSTFSVTLPYEWQRAEGDEVRIGPTVRPARSLEGRRILLVEDHPLNRKIATSLLTKEGAQVETAENGKLGVQALLDAPAGSFDVVLMDIRMPVMDGLDAARAIRASDHPDAASIPIIAISANAFDEDVQKSFEAGMTAHLTKPIDVDQLYDVLLELLSE